MKVMIIGRKEFLKILAIAATIAALIIIGQVINGRVVPSTTEPFYQGMTEEKMISLTINVDWGEEYLPDMLKILEKEDVKATFFLTGRWAKEHPQLAKKIADDGHEIGNHAYSHTSPNSMSYEENREEILKSAAAIKEATGVETTLYAPPSGEKESQVLKAAHSLGYQTILWSIDTVDWKRPAATVISERVLKKAHAGGIVLSHPTYPTVEALPTILQGLKKAGYSLVTVSQIIGSVAEEPVVVEDFRDDSEPQPQGKLHIYTKAGSLSSAEAFILCSR